MLKSKINQINQLLLDEKYNGSVLIAHQSKVIFNHHYGMADFELDAPVSEKTKFRIASITKILASLPLIMELEEQGALQLESTLGSLMPKLKNTNKDINSYLILAINESVTSLRPLLSGDEATVSPLTYLNSSTVS